MKKAIIIVAVLSLFVSHFAFAGSYGGGFHSSGSSFHSSGSSFHSTSSYGGGFHSTPSSTGSFRSSSTSSYGGGFKTPSSSTGSFLSSPTPKATVTSAPKVTMPPPVKTADMSASTYTHISYAYYHPFGYYMNPFSGNWFMWWWLFGNHSQNTTQTTVKIDCSDPKQADLKDCKK